MKFKKFQEIPEAEIPNFLNVFRNEDIYLAGCAEALQKYRTEIKQLSKRSIVHYYLSGKSAVPADLVIKLSENHPEILEECFRKATSFASRANKGHKLPKKITHQLAYLAGCLRDGTLDTKRYCISITQKKEAESWLKLLTDIFRDEFGVKAYSRKFRDCVEIRVHSKPLALYIKEILGMPANQKIWETPAIVKENKELWKFYIAGFFDAEGYCTKPETLRKTGKKKISFHQNNRESLEFIKNALNTFGIKTSEIYLQRDRNCFSLFVQSDSGIKKFAENFPIIRKKKELHNLVTALETPKLVPPKMSRSSAWQETGKGVKLLIGQPRRETSSCAVKLRILYRRRMLECGYGVSSIPER